MSEHISDIFLSAIYLTSVIVLSGLSLVCTAVVMNIYLMDPPTPMSPLMRNIVFRYIGRLVYYKHQHRVEQEPGKPNMSSQSLCVKNLENETIELSDTILTRTTDGQLLLEIRKLTQKIEEDKKEDNFKYEWKEAAKVLDRVFLIIFGIIEVLISLILFCG